MEGPRAVRTEEMESLRALTDVVFRPNMPEQYPQLFNADNYENLRVCVENGQCVSHVGMTEQQASLFGCTIQVGCIGAVSTHPDFRKQGLASECFDDAVAKAYRDGVDIFIVSGNRNLYRMRGCLRVGIDSAFSLTSASATSLAQQAGVSVRVDKMQPEELAEVMDCYRREPVRFVRPVEDYQYALQCAMVMNRFSDFLVIREQDAFRGYLILHRPAERAGDPTLEIKTGIAEFAGDRRALLAALPRVLVQYELNELRWQVSGHDSLFRSLCEQAGLTPTPVPAPGTTKLINFPQLMERMRPRFDELLGWKEAAKLSFWQREDQYGFRLDDAELVTDRDTATRIVFGTLEGTEAEALEGHGKLTEALKTIFPLPCLWYGINYV